MTEGHWERWLEDLAGYDPFGAYPGDADDAMSKLMAALAVTEFQPRLLLAMQARACREASGSYEWWALAVVLHSAAAEGVPLLEALPLMLQLFGDTQAGGRLELIETLTLLPREGLASRAGQALLSLALQDADDRVRMTAEKLVA